MASERNPAIFAPAFSSLERGLAARTLSPALVVRLDAVRSNLRRILELAGGDPGRWRPHVKTAKIPRVFAELVRAGLRRFKCATTREAACLLATIEAEGATDADVLVAYPLVGPALERISQLARRHPSIRLSVLCEDVESVAQVPANLGLFIDVDPGMQRSGIPLHERDTILAIAARAAGRFRGLHVYDGHLHDPDQAERRRRAFEVYARASELIAPLGIRAETPLEIVTSGTASFVHALAFEAFRALANIVHTVSPGTVVYNDMRTEEENPALGLEPAALVFTRVVSRPARDRVTCDAGSKAVAAEAGDPCARVLGRAELLALQPSEEHLPLQVLRGERPARGAELLLFPRHVCPTVNLAEEALLLEGDELVEIAPVGARAHDLY